MTTGATGQLGLALPVQGELSGTWGDTVNNGITQYTNIAIAGTLTLTGDGAVTLANTTGDASASNITSSLSGAGTVTAQFAIVKVSGTTTTKVVTGPSYSKTYVVDNASSFAVTFKASGQTGVSIAAAEKVTVVFNGTDYIKLAGTIANAAGSNTQIQFNNGGLFGASANLTWDGTTLSSTQVNITGQGTLRLQDTTGGEYVGLRSPSALGASYTLTFPADDGTSGQALITDGSGVLSWSTAASGDVYGPASSTDNAVARFDSTTGKLLQNSVVLIGDTGAVTGVTDLTASGSVTLSGGTANGVAYLNGSKVVTSGGSLVFNGTRFSNVVTSDTNTTVARFGVINSASTDDAYLDVSVDAANNLVSFTSTGNNVGSFAFLNSGTENMRLTSTGLGIGTSSPISRLDIFNNTSTTAPAARFYVNASGNTPSSLQGFSIYNNVSGGFVDTTLVAGNTANTYMAFGIHNGTSYAESARITTSGNFGIGTTGPVTKFQVNSGSSYVGGFKSTVANGFIAFQDSGTSGALTDGNVAIGAISDALAFRSGGATRMRLDSAGNLGLGVTPSAWGTGYKAIQLLTSALYGTTSRDMNLGANVYVDAVGYKYIQTSFATNYTQYQGAHSWYTAPSGTAGNAITFTQAMTLTADGNLGIGSTSPTNLSNYKTITMNATTGSIIDLQSAGTTLGRIQTDTTYALALWTATATPMVFGTNYTERARIDSSGNLAIGDTANSAAGRLYVKGSGATSGSVAMVVRNSTPDDLLYIRNDGYMTFGVSTKMTLDASGNLLVGTTSTTPSSSNGVIVNVSAGNTAFMHQTGTASGTLYQGFYLGGTNIGTITQSGTTAVLYNTTSDQRLKENIADAESASALIDALQVRKFDWKADGSHQRYGFVAQELVTVAPEAVHQPEDTEEMMAVDYSKLVPMLVKEIQSLRKRLADAGI